MSAALSAPAEAPALGAGPLRLLCSYHYFKGSDMEKVVAKFPHPPQIFADSGGFSAFSQGVSIDIDHFVWWCKRWRSQLHVIANLDDLNSPAATWRNQQRLEAEGLAPIPVFHLGADFDWLRRYLDAGYRYIALGKMVGRPLPAVMRWAIQCFKLARPYGAVFHGFGLTRAEAIEALPFYSVDSSSWSSGKRFGRVVVWDPDRRRFDGFNLWDRRSVARHGRAIRAAGYDPAVFLDKERYAQSYSVGLSALAWLHFEAHVRRRHGPVELPADAARHMTAAPAGLNLHLAVGTGSDHNSLAAAAGGASAIEARVRAIRRADAGLNLHLAIGNVGSDDDALAAAAGGVDAIEARVARIRAKKKGTP